MTATGIAKTRAELLKAKAVTTEVVEVDDIVIGKDVLELVSSAMYVDPMTVYREYIQNAADAIDTARQTFVLAERDAGTVDISVEPATRTVKIRDNGIGIPWSDFARRLTAVGGSGKRGTNSRGFRGVGRLAGLGYCKELIFRSRTAGDDRVSELRWDCRQLKVALREAQDHTSIAQLIQGIVTLQRISSANYPERFFEVELNGIIRLRNDKLMTPAAISEYLGEVAPVPFAPEFSFGAEISAALRSRVALGELEIRLNGVERPVYRPHRDVFTLDDKSTISLHGLQIVEIPAIEGECAAIVWTLHHEYEGAIPNSTQVKGLRMRAGNVQVGDHNLLEDLYPEPRFNVWSVGEVHVIDRQIAPNGRRDHFEQNAHYNNLINHLAPIARDIARRCRTSSIQRKWIREFEIQKTVATDIIGVIEQRSLPIGERQKLASSVEQQILQLNKIGAMEVLKGCDIQSESVIEDLKEKLSIALGEPREATPPLMRLNESERKTYEHFFDLIYKCSVNRVAAKSLIDRILLQITTEV